MQRIAVLSDIHGNLPALEAVCADLDRRDVSTVFNLGDHASGPLWPAETLDLLMRQPWLHIAGNHDRQLVHQPPVEHNASDRYAYAQLKPPHLEWLRALPAAAQPEGDLLLCHGTPSTDKTYLLETVGHGRLFLSHPAEIRERLGEVQASMVLCGHSHVPRLVHLEHTLLVNPGSVGLQAYPGSTPEPHVLEMGSPHARYAILERQPKGWAVEFITLPYDNLLAAEQARKNGRAEWAAALATGYLHE